MRENTYLNLVGGRIIQAIPTMVLVTVAVFLIPHLIPGDPTVLLAGDTGRAEDIAKIREQLGLDKPFLIQYLTYMSHVLHGDLGYSFKTRMAVVDVIHPPPVFGHLYNLP